MLVHGTQGSLETFCRNIGPLSEHYRVIAFDLVGSGFSGKPDHDYDMGVYAAHLGAVMDVLDIAKASFVGVSLGAGVLARFMVDFPGRTEHAALISAVGLSFDETMVQRVGSQRSAAVEDPTWERVRGVIRNLVFDDASVMPDIVAVRRRAYLLPDARSAVRHTIDGLRDPARRQVNLVSAEEWSQVLAPVLLVLAVDTEDTFLETGRRLAEILPNATSLEMKHVGHWPHLEDPRRFNEAVIEFFDGREG
ncbi:alpha/beta fold hydrolase [Streptomyces sp. NPDC090499]|uniref:alpha/beta fold hydrolase n=1 Tax=Streptomyces sp. NPDC090499 TaxID=3365965 RepID=UPI00380A9C4E